MDDGAVAFGDLGEGTGGVFQVLEKTAYHASFAFNGWQPERNKKWREVIEVEVKPGDDIERAIIVRMITLIRTHYTGDFQWESHRLDRVVVLRGELAGHAAVRQLHALLAGPRPLVAALASKLRTLAKVAGAQGSSSQIAKQLGMQPWLVEQAQREVRRWTPEGLVRSIQVTAEADAQVKGLSRDPVYAVEHAVTVIAASARR